MQTQQHQLPLQQLHSQQSSGELAKNQPKKYQSAFVYFSQQFREIIR